MILLIDDDTAILMLLRDKFNSIGVKSDVATSYEDCERLGYFDKQYDAVVADRRLLNNENGLDIIKEYKVRHPDVTAILHSAYDIDESNDMSIVDLTVTKEWNSVENLVHAVMMYCNGKITQNVIRMIFTDLKEMKHNIQTLSGRVDKIDSMYSDIKSTMEEIRKDNKDAVFKIISAVGGIVGIISIIMTLIITFVKLQIN